MTLHFEGSVANPGVTPGGTLAMAERKPSVTVLSPPGDDSMTTKTLTKADWAKLAVGAIGGTSLGLGVLVSPAIPLAALAAGIGFVLIANSRSTRS